MQVAWYFAFLNKAIINFCSYLYIPAMDAFDPVTINENETQGRNTLVNTKIPDPI
jgi:hypothetical protein